MSWRRWRRSPKRSQEIDFSSDIKTERRYNHHIEYLSSFHLKATSKFHPIKLGKQSLSYSRHHFKGCIPGTVKVWDEGIENYLQRKLMNVPCLQPKGVNWIKVRPNFHRRNLSFCLGLHNCRPFCCTFFQYNLQRGSPSNALPCVYTHSIRIHCTALWWCLQIYLTTRWSFSASQCIYVVHTWASRPKSCLLLSDSFL
jgi:hypothetical protein